MTSYQPCHADIVQSQGSTCDALPGYSFPEVFDPFTPTSFRTPRNRCAHGPLYEGVPVHRDLYTGRCDWICLLGRAPSIVAAISGAPANRLFQSSHHLVALHRPSVQPRPYHGYRYCCQHQSWIALAHARALGWTAGPFLAGQSDTILPFQYLTRSSGKRSGIATPCRVLQIPV